jgi:hypothetical protein
MRSRSRRPSLATVIALAALAVAVFGTVQGSWAAGSAGSKAVKSTVALRTGQSTVLSGEVQEVSASCPGGYSVIGGSYAISGSVLAHASSSEVKSAINVYAVEVVNPPATLGEPAQDAAVLVGAICAKNSTPIIVNGKFK